MATLIKIEFQDKAIFYAFDLPAEEAMAKVDTIEGITRRREMYNENLPVSTAEFDLPALQGSEKQIAWALDIRRGKIEDYAKKMNGTDREAAAAADLLRRIFGSTSAKLYIESRNSDTMFQSLRRRELAAK